MNKNFRSTKFIVVFSLILSVITIIGLGQGFMKKIDEQEVYHSSLVIIQVLGKSKNPESYSDFSIDVKNTSEPYQEF